MQNGVTDGDEGESEGYFSASGAMLGEYDKKVSLPTYPQPNKDAEFPYIAIIAPIAIGIVVFLFLQSTFVLVFAFLAPLMFFSIYSIIWASKRKISDTSR